MSFDMHHSLEVYHHSQLVFYSDRNWIHPLFELELFLQRNKIPIQELVVCDKIVGKAAALLLAYFQISQIKAELISQLGIATLQYFNIKFDYQKKVERIYCQTEQLLVNENDPVRAYEILKARARQNPPDTHPE